MLTMSVTCNTRDDSHDTNTTSCSSKDWDTMISWIKERIMLRDLTMEILDKIWKKDPHSDVVTHFIGSPSARKLLVAYDQSKKGSNRLFVSTSSLPSGVIQTVKDVAYFLRRTDSSIHIANIGMQINFGTVASVQTAEALKDTVEKVYRPLVFEERQWSRETRKELVGHYHRFLASLTEKISQVKNETQLYCPPLSDIHLDASDTDSVKDLESIIIHWTRQIKEATHSHASEDKSTLLEEIDFWRSRCDDLSNVFTQLNSVESKNIARVLADAKSSYLDPFNEVSAHIQRGLHEAQDNVKFLSLLKSPCEKLAVTEVKNIRSIMPALINCVRVIKEHSAYYNMKDRFGGILIMITNEIIHRCRAELCLDSLFTGIDTSDLILRLEEAIACGLSWKHLYERIAQVRKGFSQLDAFLQRCRDIIDLCTGYIQFSVSFGVQGGIEAYVEFGGTKGVDVMKMLFQVQTNFLLHLKQLRNLTYDILDVRALQWHEDFNKTKTVLKDLEVKYANAINTAFGPIKCVQSGVHLLEIFSYLSHRKAIKNCIEEKALHVVNLFLLECNDARKEFDANRKIPPLRPGEPLAAGAAIWAESIKRSLKISWDNLSHSKYNFENASHLDGAKDLYKSVIFAIETFQENHYRGWVESLLGPGEVEECLKKPLLQKKILQGCNAGQLILCNTDDRLMSLFAETAGWEKLAEPKKFEIPDIYHSISHKRADLLYVNAQIMLVVRAYSEIFTKLSNDECTLFADHLRGLDKQIRPGLSKLTWSTRTNIVDKFVHSCTQEAIAIECAITSFMASKEIIRRACHDIASVVMVKIDGNSVYHEGDFESQQINHRKETTQFMSGANVKVRNALAKMCKIFKDRTSPDVRNEWNAFVNHVDQALEKAYLKTVKCSLTEISACISGNMKSGESRTLFSTRLLLSNEDRIEYRPSLIELTHSLNSVTKELIKVTSELPRPLNFTNSDFLSGIDQPDKKLNYYAKISSDESILGVLVHIMNGMAACTTNLKGDIKLWYDYKALWEIDKDSFLRRYSKAERPLESFDKDISRYQELQDRIEAEDTIRFCSSVKVDVSALKQTLSNHCLEWREKFTDLLQQRALTELHSVQNDMDLVTEKGAVNKADGVTRNLPDLEKNINSVKEIYRYLSEVPRTISLEEHELLSTLWSGWESVQEKKRDIDLLTKKSDSSF